MPYLLSRILLSNFRLPGLFNFIFSCSRRTKRWRVSWHVRLSLVNKWIAFRWYDIWHSRLTVHKISVNQSIRLSVLAVPGCHCVTTTTTTILILWIPLWQTCMRRKPLCVRRWWWLFPRLQGFWENVWRLIPRLRFFFFFFLSFFRVEINSRSLIPLFEPGSVHSGSASWYDCGRMFPDMLRVSSFPDRFPHYARKEV